MRRDWRSHGALILSITFLTYLAGYAGLRNVGVKNFESRYYFHLSDWAADYEVLAGGADFFYSPVRVIDEVTTGESFSFADLRERRRRGAQSIESAWYASEKAGLLTP